MVRHRNRTCDPGRKALNPRGLGTESPSIRTTSSFAVGERVIGPRQRAFVGRISSDHVWPDWGAHRGAANDILMVYLDCSRYQGAYIPIAGVSNEKGFALSLKQQLQDSGTSGGSAIGPTAAMVLGIRDIEAALDANDYMQALVNYEALRAGSDAVEYRRKQNVRPSVVSTYDRGKVYTYAPEYFSYVAAQSSNVSSRDIPVAINYLHRTTALYEDLRRYAEADSALTKSDLDAAKRSLSQIGYGPMREQLSSRIEQYEAETRARIAAEDAPREKRIAAENAAREEQKAEAEKQAAAEAQRERENYTVVKVLNSNWVNVTTTDENGYTHVNGGPLQRMTVSLGTATGEHGIILQGIPYGGGNARADIVCLYSVDSHGNPKPGCPPLSVGSTYNLKLDRLRTHMTPDGAGGYDYKNLPYLAMRRADGSVSAWQILELCHGEDCVAVSTINSR